MAPSLKLPRAPRAASGRRGPPAVLATAALLLATPRPGAAQARRDPTALLSEAEEAERAFDFSRAEARYRAVVDLAPASREARRARARLDYLAERRDPRRGYAPLASLERARRTDLDRSRAEAFAAEVEAMPEGRVKRDALYLLGETWLRRLGDPRRAIGLYEALLRSPGVTPQEREVARFARAEALAAVGNRDAAIDAMEDAGLGRTFEARALRAEERRARLRITALAVLALALSALLAAGRPWRAGRAATRRAISLPRLLVLLYVVVPPAVIAELYEPGTADSFLLFGAVVAPALFLVSLAADSLAARDAGRGARALTVAGAVLAPLALAYLVLDAADGLASFGL